MGEWSEAAKERAEARKFYRMDEACACIPAVLLEDGCNKKKAVMAKMTLFRRVVLCCEDGRKIAGGRRIPTIENTEVLDVDRKFLKNNWSEITDRLADDGEYIVWEGGKKGGVRLGTLDEYIEQQKQVRAIAQGVIKKHNRRTDIISDAGKESEYLGLMLGAPDDEHTS